MPPVPTSARERLIIRFMIGYPSPSCRVELSGDYKVWFVIMFFRHDDMPAFLNAILNIVLMVILRK